MQYHWDSLGWSPLCYGMKSSIILLAYSCTELTSCSHVPLLIPIAPWWSLFYCCPQFTDENTQAMTDEMCCPADSAESDRTRIWTPAAWLPASLPAFSAIMNSWTIHFAFLTALTWKMKRKIGQIIWTNPSCSIILNPECLQFEYFWGKKCHFLYPFAGTPLNYKSQNTSVFSLFLW